MNKNEKVHIFFGYWLPFLLWAIVIFLFSANPTTRTSEIHWQDFIVKKTAHIVEYAVFTTLLYRALRKSDFDLKKAGYTALATAFLYGTTDEYHQSFTPGREPTLRDIIVDSLGSGIALYVIWYYLPKASQSCKKLAKRMEII